MDTVVFLTYSHADYVDISELMIDGLKLLPSNMKKILCTNNGTQYPEPVRLLYDDIIEYPDNIMYPAKIVHCLEKINAKYIIFVHDIELVYNFNNNIIVELIALMDKHSIDRLMFGVIPKQSNSIEGSCFTLTMANKKNLSPNWYTPYDVGPSVWKKDTLLNMMKKYSTYSYRDIEYCGIQDDLCAKNIYAFTTNSNYNAIYPIGRPFTPLFTFIHILVRGKWLVKDFYFEVIEYLTNLINKYNIDLNKRGTLELKYTGFNRCV